MVVLTWLCPFSVMIPTWGEKWGKFGLDESIGSCTIMPDKNGHSPKEVLFVVAFVVPCICITFCYASIFYLVRKAAVRSREPAAAKSMSVQTSADTNAASSASTLTTTVATPTTVVPAEQKPFEVNEEDIEYIDVSDSNDAPYTYNITTESTTKTTTAVVST